MPSCLNLRRGVICVAALLTAGLLAVPGAGVRAEPNLKPIPDGVKNASYEKDIQPLLARYCVQCHQGEKARGGIDFEAFASQGGALKKRDVWKKVADNLESGAMPPEGKTQPTEAERSLLAGWIQTRMLALDCGGVLDPGRVTLRRLNRVEYNNTIRDLLGVDFKPAEDFPSDDVGYGFDNIGDVLSMPPILLEKYLAAAEKVTDTAIVTADADRAPVKKGKGGTLASSGEIGAEFEFPHTAEYLLRCTVHGDQAGDEPAKMTVRFDDKDVETVDVPEVDGAPKKYEKRVAVEAGKRRFAVKFINDYYNPKDPDPKNRDRNLIVEGIEIQGPIGILPDKLPDSHTRLITCRPEAGKSAADCTRVVLRSFATRAFRRPVSDDETDRLVRLVEKVVAEGDSFERGIQIAVSAVLVSPHFLFRVELDPEPANPKAVRTLNDYELATRLSYFLWSSMPDEELFRLAATGTLRKDGNLAVQVRRMLKDPKSTALVENFAGQWLQLRNLKNFSPDNKRFENFDDGLRAAMERETKLFFETIVRDDHSILDFLDANFTFLNERLAKHYGIEGVTGDEFRRVTLTTDQRGGLLGHASILSVTSNPTRTSPVKRGKWVLENLFNAPPPPPPPGVPELSEAKEKVLSGTLRQRMQQHRENPACAACHTQMDALGFGLENYDAIGAWRWKDGEFEIDPSGTLANGQAFTSPAELRTILKSRHNEFRRCLAEKLLTYSLGRGLEYYDQCTVDRIVKNTAANQDRFSALVLEIVGSEPFQKRRGKSGDEQ